MQQERSGPQKSPQERPRLTLWRWRTLRKTDTSRLHSQKSTVTIVHWRATGTTVKTTPPSRRRFAYRTGTKTLRFIRPRRQCPPAAPPPPLSLPPPPAPRPFLPNAHREAQVLLTTSRPTKLGSTSASTLLDTSSRAPAIRNLSPRPPRSLLCLLCPSRQRKSPPWLTSPPRSPAQSSKWPGARWLRSCLASPPSSRAPRRSSRLRTIHLSAQTTEAWRRPCPPSSEGPLGHFNRGSDRPPSPGQTGATLRPFPQRSPAWPRLLPLQLRCPDLAAISLTARSQAAAASPPARRESKNWTWWCHRTKSFDHSQLCLWHQSNLHLIPEIQILSRTWLCLFEQRSPQTLLHHFIFIRFFFLIKCAEALF